MATNEDGGLRARKKYATREALSAAALRLAKANGLDNVRVNDIADAANVSPRTYNNYFSSVEEAIVASINAERSKRIVAALRARPADEPLDEAVTKAVVSQYMREPEGNGFTLISTTPRLRREYVKSAFDFREPLAEAIAERVGCDTLMHAVLASAVSAAVRVALDLWVQPSANPDAAAKGFVVVTGERPLPELLRDALACVAPALRAAGAQGEGAR